MSSSFYLAGNEGSHQVHDPDIPAGEFSSQELSRLEKATLSIFVSGHPLIGLEDQIARYGARTVTELQEVRDKTTVTVIGMIGKIKRLTTKKGDPMAFVNLEDLAGNTEVVVFSDLYSRCKDLLVEDEVVVVKGRADLKGIDEDGNRDVKIIASEISEFVREDGSGGEGSGDEIVQLSLDHGEFDPGSLEDMKDNCQNYPGCAPVIISMMTADGVRKMKLGHQVDPAREFLSCMQGFMGVLDVSVSRQAPDRPGVPA